MGLQKSFNSGFGIAAPEGYHRIKSVTGDSDKNISYIVELFYNKEACDTGKAPLSILSKSVPQDLVSRIGVIYELYQILKTEPEYLGAIDIIESDDFTAVSNYDISNSYAIDLTLADGYALVGNEGTDVVGSGKVILGGQVISGIHTGLNITSAVESNGKIVQGFITAGTCNGLIVQHLV